MNIKELINRLQKFDPQLEVTILDSFNGGMPRTINFVPTLFDPSDNSQTFEDDTAQDYSDIRTPVGMPIVIMGYGFS